MIISTYYVIWHKATNQFMPARLFRTVLSGHTYWEPTNASGYGGLDYPTPIPRLFKDHSTAAKALNAWLKGEHSGNGKNRAIFAPAIPRHKDEVEILTVTLRQEY